MADAIRRKKETKDSNLSGTTLRVYRYLYRKGKYVGLREIQRDLRFSSVSVAEYHIKKLLSIGLVKGNESSLYFVDGVIFENMIRIRKALIPVQIGFLAFFGASLAILLVIFRPSDVTNSYLFSITVVIIGIIIFMYQSIETLRSSSI